MWGATSADLYYATTEETVDAIVRARLRVADEVIVEGEEVITPSFAVELSGPGRPETFFDVSAVDGRVLGSMTDGVMNMAADEPVVVLNIFKELEARSRRR